MQNSNSQEVVLRFFEALRELKSRGVIRGAATFCTRHHINRRHLYIQEHEPQRDVIQLCWLSYLVADYGVSARWLLTGDGGMFDD